MVDIGIVSGLDSQMLACSHSGGPTSKVNERAVTGTKLKTFIHGGCDSTLRDGAGDGTAWWWMGQGLRLEMQMGRVADLCAC